MSKNQEAIVSLVKRMSGQHAILTIPRIYVDMTGDHVSALFLSQCVYYSDISTVGGGWFAKSLKEWHEEVGLTRSQVERCVETCGRFIERKVKKFSGAPTVHYRPDLREISTWICDFLANGNATNSEMDLRESRKSITDTSTNTSTEKTTDDSVGALTRTSPESLSAESSNESELSPSPKRKPAKRKAQSADTHPMTRPIMQAFVECLPGAMQATFDYARAGKEARELAIMGITEANIRTYYAMLRASWNKSPAMRERPVTFHALADFIKARAQESVMRTPIMQSAAASAEIARYAVPSVEIEAEAEDEPMIEAEAEPAHVTLWKRAQEAVKGMMTRAAYEQYLLRAQGVAFDGQTLRVALHNEYAYDWVTHRLSDTVERAVRMVAGDGACVAFEVLA